MPKRFRPFSTKNDAELDPFALQVEQALERFSDPEWLGSNSPLAAPYFLGQALDVTVHDKDAAGRGQALQNVLSQAAATLEFELSDLLRLVYFKRDPHFDNIALALSLHLSERTFYRLRHKAIQTLAQTLNQLLLPPLRSETPLQRLMIGREGALGNAISALRNQRSVSISGPSGIGKTILGAAIAQRWLREGADGSRSGRHVFWYTLHGGFNDQLTSLMFTLGYFLRSLGATQTWRQLVADRGLPNPERTLSLLRYDLNSLEASPPLICIDEIDVLQDDVGDHVQILNLLEEASTFCPTLIVGQRVVFNADEHIRLSGINQVELEGLLQHVNAPPLSTEQRQQLLAHTRGNPALIILFAALLRNGDDPASALRTLAKSPSLEGLFNRIWRRLGEAEQQLLFQLAVFRHASPLDAWRDQQATLDRLHQRELAQYVSQGGVQVLPHLQRLIYGRIPAEAKPLLHLRAMELREMRAEHLAAIYHAIEGGQAGWAVWHWFAHRKQETERGQGATALELLRLVSPSDLAEEQDRTVLRMAKAELLQLAGKPEEAEQELQATATPSQSASRAFVRRLEGYALDSQGRIEQALQKYRESLEALLGLPQYNAVITHTRISFLQRYHLNNVEQARREALLARAKADAFLGDLETMAGRYQTALDYLMSAKAGAEEPVHDLTTLGQVYCYLGVVYIKLEEYDTAISYLDQAIDCDRKRGDEVGLLYNIMNRATAFSLAGRYEEGYQDARGGLATAEKLRATYLISGLAACMAEACHGLRRWEEGEHYANHALNQEEVFFRAPTLLVLGRIRLEQKKYGESINLLTAARDSAQEIEDLWTEANAWEQLGLARHRLGSTDEARLAFESALRIYTDLNLPKEIDKMQTALQSLPLSVKPPGGLPFLSNPL